MTDALLHNWGEQALLILQADVDLYAYISAEEVLHEWRKIDLITENQSIQMKVDYWGSPLRWDKWKKDGVRFIRIGSPGRNKVWEDGKGDDMYVEIRIPPQGTKPELFYKP